MKNGSVEINFHWLVVFSYPSFFFILRVCGVWREEGNEWLAGCQHCNDWEIKYICRSFVHETKALQTMAEKGNI